MFENVLEEPVAEERLGRDPFWTHVEPVARILQDLGYTSSTVRTCRWCLSDFSRWVVRKGVWSLTSTTGSSALSSLNGSTRAGSTGAIDRQSAAFLTNCVTRAL